MQRYFVSKDSLGNFVFSEQDIFHITKVMRSRINDNVEVVNGGKVYIVNIDSLSPLSVHVLSEISSSSELPFEVTLFLPLLKSDKTDLIIQKATELGVNKIVFYLSKRSIIRLEQKDFEKKLNRYVSIAKEASEQCHRTVIPSIEGVINLNDIDSYKLDNNLIAYELMCGNTSSLEEALNKKGSTSVILGPEGGFEENEVKILINKGFTPISLGKRILRVETAAIYAMSVISFNMEK